MKRKKSLGQHFLKDPNILRKIVESARLSKTEDIVLEIGPGEGSLTELLLANSKKVIAVEKDDRLIPRLQEKFKKEISTGTLELTHSDILDFNPSTHNLKQNSYSIVANIPYYITGLLLKKFLQENAQPKSMVLLLQKEVAERIIAKNKRESILSISVKCYGKPRIAGIVKAGSFSPPPKVDSAILILEEISKNFFKTNSREISEEKFFAMLKKGFAHPRKFMASNLKVDKLFLKERGTREDARAEDMSLSDWKYLFTNLN